MVNMPLKKQVPLCEICGEPILCGASRYTMWYNKQKPIQCHQNCFDDLSLADRFELVGVTIDLDEGVDDFCEERW